MTESEFYDWLEGYHGARFQWLSKYFDDQDNPQETKRAWFYVLKSLPVQSVQRASDALFGDEKLASQSLDRHPGILRRLASTVSNESTGDRFPKGKFVLGEDGQRVWAFHCHFCEDSGFVAIWTDAAAKCYADQSHKFDEFARGHWRFETYTEGGVEKKRLLGWCYHQLVIRCRCERGNAFGQTWCKVQFDPDRHRRVYRPDKGTWEDSLAPDAQDSRPVVAVPFVASNYDPDRGWR